MDLQAVPPALRISRDCQHPQKAGVRQDPMLMCRPVPGHHGKVPTLFRFLGDLVVWVSMHVALGVP
jgi:hypothetical protein